MYWELFYNFFIMGIVCFGGGYAMLPFIQNMVVSNGWLTPHEFADMIAVAQSTPGPVSINTATFVGYKMGGVLGATISTISLVLPAFLLIIFFTPFLYSQKGSVFLDRILIGIKPVVVALIFISAYEVLKTVVHIPFAIGVKEIIALCIVVCICYLNYVRKVDALRLIAITAIFAVVYSCVQSLI